MKDAVEKEVIYRDGTEPGNDIRAQIFIKLSTITDTDEPVLKEICSGGGSLIGFKPERGLGFHNWNLV